MNFDTFRQEIEAYLPIDFYDEENNTYKRYLLDALTENWENEKYQFCLLATNMLFMSYLYKGFWFLLDKHIQIVDKKVQMNQRYSVEAPYELSVIPEKSFIEDYLPIYNIGKERRKIISMLIDCRDSCAHANGEILFEKDDLESKFQEYNKAINDIFNKHKSFLVDSFKNTFDNYLNNELCSKPCCDFLQNFCSKEKVSTKELIEVFNYINTVVIRNSDRDYVQKQFVVFILKFYLSIKTCQKVDYNVENLKDDLSLLCSANLDKTQTIKDILESEWALSGYKVATEDEFNILLDCINGYLHPLSEVEVHDELIPSVDEFYDIAGKSEKEISDEYSLALLSNKEDKN